MASKKGLIFLGIGSVIVIGGGIAWFLMARKQSKTGEQKSEESKTSGGASANPLAGVVTGSTSSSLPPAPFKNTTEGNAFRVWMSVKHPDFRYAGDVLDPSGAYDNDFVRKAYQMYGSEYTKSGGATAVSSGSATKTNPVASGNYKVYANKAGTPVWSGVNDLVPYRYAGDSEWLGTTKLAQAKSYVGNPFYVITQPDGSTVYVSIMNVKFKP